MYLHLRNYIVLKCKYSLAWFCWFLLGENQLKYLVEISTHFLFSFTEYFVTFSNDDVNCFFYIYKIRRKFLYTSEMWRSIGPILTKLSLECRAGPEDLPNSIRFGHLTFQDLFKIKKVFFACRRSDAHHFMFGKMIFEIT